MIGVLPFLCLVLGTLVSAEHNPGGWTEPHPWATTRPKRSTEISQTRSMSTNASRHVPCLHSNVCSYFDDVLLVIKLNPVRLLWLDTLLEYYGLGFRNVVFFSALRHGDHQGVRHMHIGRYHTTVHFVDDNYGFCDHETVAWASRWWPSFTGYMFLSDDVLLQYWKVLNFDKEMIWRQKPSQRSKEHMTASELKAVEDIHGLSSGTVLRNLPRGSTYPFAATSGWYYVPSGMMPEFRRVSRILLRYRTYNEWGTPILLTAVGGTHNVMYVKGKLVWGRKRFLGVKTMLQDHLTWYHPVRGSSETLARMVHWVRHVPQLTATTRVTAVELFDTTCFECATHPAASIGKKGLYHHCAPASSANACDRTPRFEYAVTSVVREHGLQGVPATAWVGGRVHVSSDAVGVENPLELSHEGFWGKDIVLHVYESYLPWLNHTWVMIRN